MLSIQSGCWLLMYLKELRFVLDIQNLDHGSYHTFSIDYILTSGHV
jgi:hypothetical protein